MLLKYFKNILAPQDGAAKICAVCWSANNVKCAVCTSDRVVLLYDEAGEKRDKFSLKPADPKFGKTSYTVKGLCFSPDSTKIAIGQTDNIIYVYKIGTQWGDKKVICNKFVLQSSVTAMVWPNNQALIFGQVDGKVRAANMKSNKSSTIYATNSYIVSLAASPSGKAFISGHADCSIVRYTFEDDGSGETRGLLCHHSSAPYALAYTSHGIIVGGCDKKIVAYDRDGHCSQQFDFSREEDENEFTCAVCSPSGFSVIFGSFNRLKILNWNPRKGLWEDPINKIIPNLYTITALSWKPDGSRVLVGTLCGSVEVFNSTLKKINYKKKFEIVHVGLNQVIVTCLSSGQKTVLKSQYGYEIDNVRIMGSDRYAVANSTQTIILADLLTNKFTEIPWQSTGENEKFYFDNENSTVIYIASSHLFFFYHLLPRTPAWPPPPLSDSSVRLNERQTKRCHTGDNKRLAYLLDMKTVVIVDLVTENAIAEVEHDSKVDWLELNETGRYLLFRDKKLKLNLYFIEAQQRVTILNSCLYVQWVPGSDVVVAQNRGNLCIWYNIEAYEKVTMIPLKVKEKEGDYNVAINLYLKSGLPTKAARVVTSHENLLSNTELTSRIASALVKAELYEQAGNLYEKTGEFARALQSYRKGRSYQQDSVHLRCTTKAIESAISSNQWKKAVQILELQDSSTVTKYYKKIADHYAQVKEYKIAERLYLAADCMKEAVDMYNEVGMWQQAHKLASKFMNADAVTALYVTQADKLRDQGKVKEAERLFLTVEEPERAIAMYKQLKMYPDVLRLVKLYHRDMLEETYCRLAKEVESDGNLRQAEEYLLSANNAKAAINMYRSQNMWSDAYRIAKSHCGELMSKQVAFLWARNLGGDSAVKLLSKFGLLEEAIDYAAEQCVFDFAFDLAHVGMKEKLPSIHLKQAMYLEDEGKIAEAELGFIKAGRPKEAVLMYMHNKDWDSALRIAESHDPELVTEVLVGQAQIAFQEEDFTRAESLLLRAHQPEKAIAFYKKHEMWQDALRLCQQYLPNKLGAVQEEFEQAQMSKSSRGIETIIRQGREWESNKEFSRAVECYLKVSELVTSDVNIMMKCWHKAVDLSVKFLGHNRSVEVVDNVATRLDNMEKYAMGRKVLQKYVAIYAAHLINEGQSIQALELYTMYGAPASQQYTELSQNSDSNDSTRREYHTYLLISHYYATRAAVQTDLSLNAIAAKLSVSLLRHTDIVPADKAFYEAGLLCKVSVKPLLLFFFFFMIATLLQAIEDGTLDSLDHSDFQATDIPFEIPLPEHLFLSPSELEQQKEWVLEVSMNQNVEQVLPKDDRGVYEASLVNYQNGQASVPCLITAITAETNRYAEYKQRGNLSIFRFQHYSRFQAILAKYNILQGQLSENRLGTVRSIYIDKVPNIVNTSLKPSGMKITFFTDP
ncbi:intraflagellar transport protein 172 homolog [Octopus bimaculoides]|uniref:intraflagellar transport protein 172 homolog n=1 Tax=Octopus bimaculoides TaxID=37653 RepID=UPI0022E461E9|nr:intraflagellar transport protein 172 homolog [Octopus bimaculoides]